MSFFSGGINFDGGPKNSALSSKQKIQKEKIMRAGKQIINLFTAVFMAVAILMSAGARFMVMRPSFNANPLF